MNKIEVNHLSVICLASGKFNLLQSLLDPLRLPHRFAMRVLVTSQAERG